MKRNKLKIVVEVTIPADRRMDDEPSGLILAQARSDDHNTNQTKAQDRVSYSSRKLINQKLKTLFLNHYTIWFKDMNTWALD